MTGAIIIAAGSSARLGQPKQNLIYQNKTLLQRTIETALASNCKPVYVVLGAHSSLIKPFIQHQTIHLIQNPDWADGMSTSIKMGIAALEKDKRVSSAIILLCDQPFVSPHLIADMTSKQQETAKDIIACSYNNTLGVPVLFNRSLFPELLSLKGSEGAKKILKDHPQEIESVPFEKGGIDIDTFDDYERLLSLLH